MKILKEKKGITLVALIITIIILLILAVVSIRAVSDDGIIEKTKEARDEYTIAQEKEELQLAVLEWQLAQNNGEPTLVSHLGTKYGEENVQLNTDKSITVTVPSGNRYVVTESGEVTLLDGTVEEPTPIQPEIILDKASISREITNGVAETETLTATLNNASGELAWASSDTSVAEISGEGNTRTITLKKAGTSIITVSYGEYNATCNVTVTETIKKISFTVNDITYYAEEGMTWEQWVGSDYDTSNGGFYIQTLPSGTIRLFYDDYYSIFDR